MNHYDRLTNFEYFKGLDKCSGFFWGFFFTHVMTLKLSGYKTTKYILLLLKSILFYFILDLFLSPCHGTELGTLANHLVKRVCWWALKMQHCANVAILARTSYM